MEFTLRENRDHARVTYYVPSLANTYDFYLVSYGDIELSALSNLFDGFKDHIIFNFPTTPFASKDSLGGEVEKCCNFLEWITVTDSVLIGARTLSIDSKSTNISSDPVRALMNSCPILINNNTQKRLLSGPRVS